jgi:hypothetical protein
MHGLCIPVMALIDVTDLDDGRQSMCIYIFPFAMSSSTMASGAYMFFELSQNLIVLIPDSQ